MYVGLVRGRHFRIVSGYPSLQVPRAETLVERFTARMHVCWCLWLARGVWEHLFHARFFDAKVGS